MTFEAKLRELIEQLVEEAVERRLGKPAEPEFCTLAEAAEVARGRVLTIRRWISKGRLPVRGKGRWPRVARADVVAAIGDRRVESDSPEKLAELADSAEARR